MQRTTIAFLITALLCSCTLQAKGPAYTRPNRAKKKDSQFETQGEYVGMVAAEGDMKVGAQIIAMGGNKYSGQFYMGGLPGDGAQEKLPMIEAEAKDDGSVLFEGDQADALLKDGKISVLYEGSEIGKLERVTRKSKSLNKKPPADAIVLFRAKRGGGKKKKDSADGSAKQGKKRDVPKPSLDAWEGAMADGVMMAFDPKGRGATSKEKFGDCMIHVEFKTPYMPEARGQGRGNSGIYVQGRYEVQMLDSFGLSGADNECGGIYKISKPKENMCYPPLTWQTYDIEFTAAKYDDDGKVKSNPKMTVHHNGVVIHKDLELPHDTTAAPMKAGPEDGPIYLQNHGNPVRYRNIWAVKK